MQSNNPALKKAFKTVHVVHTITKFYYLISLSIFSLYSYIFISVFKSQYILHYKIRQTGHITEPYKYYAVDLTPLSLSSDVTSISSIQFRMRNTQYSVILHHMILQIHFLISVSPLYS